MNQTASNPIVACLEKEMPEELWGCFFDNNDYWSYEYDSDDIYMIATFGSENDASIGIQQLDANACDFSPNDLTPRIVTVEYMERAVELHDDVMGFILLDSALQEINRQYLK